MMVFTDGVVTVRVLLRAGGCEVRHGSTVLLGNADLAALLVHVHTDPHAREFERFAARIASPLDPLRAAVARAFDEMAGAGIPRTVWGAWSVDPSPTR
jgi:hypothetical protein